MIVACAIALFILSAASIYAGYYSSHQLLDAHYFWLIYREVPVFSTSLVLTALLFVNAASAFFGCRGSYRRYQDGLSAVSFTFSLFVMLVLLPGHDRLGKITNFD